uniref:Ppx/GppA phosphatase N-terminal domain-containing protein n=1 Tax=Mesoaciditoga lauensis TaxID=1495039 RepID=A0A7V3VSL4_9BACT
MRSLLCLNPYGGTGLRTGIVDAGTNSFLLLIAQKESGKIEYLLDTSTVVGFGHLEGGKVREEKLKFAVQTLDKYKKICEEYRVDKTVIVGTEVFRKIDGTYFQILSNGFDESFIITGQEEAILSYRSVSEDQEFSHLKALIVADIGGGSVEFAKVQTGDSFIRSFPIGALAITDEFIQRYPVDDQLNEAGKSVEKMISKIPVGDLVVIGGTGTTVTSLMDGKTYDPVKIHGRFLKIDDLKALFNVMKKMELDEISRMPGMEKGRERIITTGLFLLIKIIDHIDSQGSYVSVRGHRYSIAKDLLDGVKWK